MAQQRRKTRNSVKRHNPSRNEPFTIINKEKSELPRKVTDCCQDCYQMPESATPQRGHAPLEAG